MAEVGRNYEMNEKIELSRKGVVGKREKRDDGRGGRGGEGRGDEWKGRADRKGSG